jgi:hypothetical protein
LKKKKTKEKTNQTIPQQGPTFDPEPQALIGQAGAQLQLRALVLKFKNLKKKILNFFKKNLKNKNKI